MQGPWCSGQPDPDTIIEGQLCLFETMASQDCYAAQKTDSMPSTKDNTIADALAVSSVLSECMRLVGGGAFGPSAQHEKRERAGLEGSRSTLATGCSKTWLYAHGRVGDKSGRGESIFGDPAGRQGKAAGTLCLFGSE